MGQLHGGVLEGVGRGEGQLGAYPRDCGALDVEGRLDLVVGFSGQKHFGDLDALSEHLFFHRGKKIEKEAVDFAGAFSGQHLPKLLKVKLHIWGFTLGDLRCHLVIVYPIGLGLARVW